MSGGASRPPSGPNEGPVLCRDGVRRDAAAPGGESHPRRSASKPTRPLAAGAGSRRVLSDDRRPSTSRSGTVALTRRRRVRPRSRAATEGNAWASRARR
jgi:hypothetical protein